MTHLVTYSDPNMSIAAQICAASARHQGIDKIWAWTDAAIRQTDFYEQNKAILDHPRAGYWQWKPFIILDTLQRLKEGEILIYADAGVEFVASVKNITDRMAGDIWLFGNMFAHAEWCKGDVLETICPLGSGAKWHMWMDGNCTQIRHKQCQASVILLRNGSMAKEFVREWLGYCVNPAFIDDSPSKEQNFPTFREHRHDQAILTCLQIKYRMPLHWWPAMYNCGAFQYEKGGYTDNYPVLFHHHRSRNNEIQQPGMFREYFHKKYPQIV